MKLSEIRKLCGQRFNQERNDVLCQEISHIDEGFICHVDRDILTHDPDLSPLCNIDFALDELKNQHHISAGNPFYNTWPYGVPSDLYPRFLAICRGEKTLNEAFKEMQAKSFKIAKKYGMDKSVQKTVILLTDKWNNNTFRKYEKYFLNHALHDDIWYIFLLVTDYGYTQIPFLPNTKSILRSIEDNLVEDDITFEDMIELLREYPFEYQYMGGSWDRYKSKAYCFDCYELLWYRNDLYGKTKGYIPEKYLRLFLENAIGITNINKVSFRYINAIDAPVNRLNIFGKTIEWDILDNMDYYMKKTIVSLLKLIDECEKNRI